MCVRAKKNKRDFLFFIIFLLFYSRETYTKIIVIDLIIVKLFGVCPVVFFPSFFPSKRKGFSRKFCVLVCDCYFGLLIFVDNIICDLTSAIKAMVRVEVMIGEEGKASGIKKFDGTNFGYWRMQIEDYLYRKKLHQPFLGMKPKTMKDEE